MDDYFIENDMPRQREIAAIEQARKDQAYEKLEQARREIEIERLSGAAVVCMFEEYKQAMEFYFGASRWHEALEQYLNENR